MSFVPLTIQASNTLCIGCLSKLSSLRSISSGIWGNVSLANTISSYNRHNVYLGPQCFEYMSASNYLRWAYVKHSAISLRCMFTGIWKNTWKLLRNKKNAVYSMSNVAIYYLFHLCFIILYMYSKSFHLYSIILHLYWTFICILYIFFCVV